MLCLVEMDNIWDEFVYIWIILGRQIWVSLVLCCFSFLKAGRRCLAFSSLSLSFSCSLGRMFFLFQSLCFSFFIETLLLLFINFFLLLF